MNKLDIRNLRLADFGHNLNKTRQSLSDVILQEGDGPTVIPTLAKKITSELAEVNPFARRPSVIDKNRPIKSIKSTTRDEKYEARDSCQIV